MNPAKDPGVEHFGPVNLAGLGIRFDAIGGPEAVPVAGARGLGPQSGRVSPMPFDVTGRRAGFGGGVVVLFGVRLGG